MDKEYIEREKAFDLITDFAGQASTKSAYSAFWKSAKAIKKIPTADVVAVKHGEWVKATPCSQEYCNQCGLTPKMVFGILPNFCPHCGAKMDLKEGVKNV